MLLKRFIAGAVCQQCGAQDKVRAWEDETEKVMRRECVSCGHHDVIGLQAPEQTELVTRVNYTDPVFDEDIQPVRILDASESKDA